MRFLMNTLLALIQHRSRFMRSDKTLSQCARALLLSSCRLRSLAPGIRGYWRGTITALGLLAPVQSCFSKLPLRQYTHPKSLPAVVCTPSLTVLFPYA
jgi:hypothetical protein